MRMDQEKVIKVENRAAILTRIATVAYAVMLLMSLTLGVLTLFDVDVAAFSFTFGAVAKSSAFIDVAIIAISMCVLYFCRLNEMKRERRNVGARAWIGIITAVLIMIASVLPLVVNLILAIAKALSKESLSFLDRIGMTVYYLPVAVAAVCLCVAVWVRALTAYNQTVNPDRPDLPEDPMRRSKKVKAIVNSSVLTLLALLITAYYLFLCIFTATL